MKVLKKTIKQAVTTGTTTGCTGSSCYVIVPDLTAVYNINVALTQENKDLGFFDVYGFSSVTGTTIPSINPITITGTCRSRLSELKKFSQNSNPIDNYKQSSTPANDGVNKTLSNNNKTVYYIGGITFTDQIIRGEEVTRFSFIKTQINSSDFVNKPIYKDPNKWNMISQPKVDDDVFIIRQQISAFNDNYKLEFINNLNELTNYAGGNYFNIVNNT